MIVVAPGVYHPSDDHEGKSTPRELSVNGTKVTCVASLAEELAKFTEITRLSAFNSNDEHATAICDTMLQSRTLKHFHLHCDQLESKCENAISKLLMKNHSITSLCLCFEHTVVGQAIGRALEHNHSLEKLEFRLCTCDGNTIGHALMKSDCSLKTLKFHRCMTTTRDIETISKALCMNHTLRTFDFSEGNLYDEGAILLANSMMENRSLEELLMNDTKVGANGVKAVANMLLTNSSLKTLELKGCKAKREGVKLAKALNKNTSLRRLNLSFSKLDKKGRIAIVNCLISTCTLTYVDLSQTIERMNVASIIAENHSLHTLVLRECMLDPPAGNLIAMALKKNHTLQNLDLRFNFLGDVGAIAIADALMENTTLTTLDLFWNGICNEGGFALANALMENISLRNLDLGQNKFNENIGKMFVRVIMKNQNLSSLNLYECGCASDDEDIVEHYTRKNGLSRYGILHRFAYQSGLPEDLDFQIGEYM